MPLVEDQDAVGEFGSEGADESFSDTVCLRTSRRNPDDVDADVSEDSVEGRGELTGSVSDEEPVFDELIAEHCVTMID